MKKKTYAMDSYDKKNPLIYHCSLITKEILKDYMHFPYNARLYKIDRKVAFSIVIEIVCRIY